MSSLRAKVMETPQVDGLLAMDRRSSALDVRKEASLVISSYNDGAVSVLTADQKMRIVVIDANSLSRTCLMRCLAASRSDFTTKGYCTVEDWRQAGGDGLISIVLLCATGPTSTEIAICRDVDVAIRTAPEACVIVVSDVDDQTGIVGALERGARGYISMNSNLDVAIAAIGLVRAGGTFVTASGLMASRSLAGTPTSTAQANEKRGKTLFTDRQLEVIDRLRKGESNKIIAYKLNMAECTVKVHVRNVMRKINARNRTQIAFLTNDMF